MNALNAYRILTFIIHIVFTLWIIEIFGFKLKTFLFLTKINFFVNFFYFFYTGVVVPFMLKATGTEKDSPEGVLEKAHGNELLTNSIFKFSFCLSTVVIILYWSIVCFASEMMGDTATPVVLDLFLHGGNLFVLLIDCFLKGRSDFKETYISGKFLIKFTIFYFILQYAVYYSMNIEIYPMVSKLSIPAYSLFSLAGYGLFKVGELFFDQIIPSSGLKNAPRKLLNKLA